MGVAYGRGVGWFECPSCSGIDASEWLHCLAEAQEEPAFLLGSMEGVQGSTPLDVGRAVLSSLQLDVGRAVQASFRRVLGFMQRDVGRAVQASFPGAMRGPEVALRVLMAIRPFGVRRDNVVYGHSICSDEINGDKGHVSTLLTQYYGTSFFLGGIGGAPCVGKTGFGAFAAHVPDSGHVVLLFGPHIGFTPNGEPGKFLRTGQAKDSTSCGAAIAALGQVTSGQKFSFDAKDLEQGWLREKLRPHCGEVAASAKQMVELAMKTYKVVEEEVFNIVNTNFGEGNLVLIGGIQINMPYPSPGFWLPLHFSIRSKTMTPKDLLPSFR
mmetsp:Transcript_80117/g.235650  ORF Transcript_80117/g.235650 Transcript_80117/m.235650 type:complete len:325 (+) Transcript_80117:70-1044(+)